jgi:hypothetical protein
MTELERLGQVDPPAPGALDAAREVLWSAVAAEMLATAPHEQRRIAEPGAEETLGQRPRAEPGEPRRPDPGAP